MRTGAANKQDEGVSKILNLVLMKVYRDIYNPALSSLGFFYFMDLYTSNLCLAALTAIAFDADTFSGKTLSTTPLAIILP